MTFLLNNLEIDGYRRINNLKLENLGRINLLVGKNNSGKTRVLDALRILSDYASPSIMTQISQEHDEHYAARSASSSTNDASFIRHFFDDRKLPTSKEDKSIFIGDPENTEVKIHLLPFIYQKIMDEEGTHRTRKFVEIETTDTEEIDAPVYRAIVSTHLENGSRTRSIVALDDDETNELTMRRSSLHLLGSRQGAISHRFVPSSLMEHYELAFLWDRVVLTDKEHTVTIMLQTINPAIEGLAFIGASRDNRNPLLSLGDRHPMLSIRGSDPIPLGSMGDGVYRIFQLALNLVNAQDGLLLIDEFENGLHYSTQTAIWKFIFNFAQKLNIQVFATTHSSDCIAAFAEAATNHPELGCAYHLGQSIIDGKTIATRYEEARLKELVDMGRDIR